MARFLTSRVVVISSIVVMCSFISSSAQRRQSSRRSTPRPPAIDYTKFSHATQKHQAACDTCHKVPSENWQRVRSYPDIIDYPDHVACVSCHRAQFFRTPRPPICSVCHTKVSPRDDVRFSFRKNDAPLQFSIVFPHDKHQDVIARLREFMSGDEEFSFRRVAFIAQGNVKPSLYNNCSICHSVRVTEVKPPNNRWLDGFVPDVASFKTSPSSHSSCFNCHWKSQEPIATNCKGCHALADSPMVTVTTPHRISIKFNHELGGQKKEHVAECTSCHINITKSASLRGLKPDVPITSCTECHNKVGLREDVNRELLAIDKNPSFVCVYCHSSDVGKLDPAPSHYLIAERPPLKRKDIK